jgi:CelD/BcsL family acetyltransferase involved in cellulose biosynthesis
MLYRVRGAAGTVGCLYGYVEQRRLMIYQSGFAAFPGDNRIKPGLVTHAMCMQSALEAGFDEYDLLAGDQRYKRELAATERQLVWARVVRRRPRPLAIAGISQVRGAARRRLRPPTDG